MEELAAAPGAGYETLVFLEYFEDLPDPRQRGKVMYPLNEVLLLALLAVLAGAETFVDIARFGAPDVFAGWRPVYARKRRRKSAAARNPGSSIPCPKPGRARVSTGDPACFSDSAAAAIWANGTTVSAVP